MNSHREPSPFHHGRSTSVVLVTSLVLCLGLFAPAAWGQGGIVIEPDPVDCLPIGDNGVAWASVDGLQPHQQVRLNFRRLNDVVEDIYWTPMHPAGPGRYWGIFPKAADEMLQRHDIEETRRQAREETRWAEWWREKDASDHRDPNRDLDDELIRERASQGKQIERHWLAELDDEEFQRWLEQLENEPAEYFVSVHDANGRQVARSSTGVTEVKDGCRPDLTPQQRGEAENLTVGETAYWQQGEEVFHWLCDGIVSRVGPGGVKRGDAVCRACVVAWWDKPGVLVPVVAGAAAGAVALYDVVDDSPEVIPPEPPPPASPDNP